MHPHILSTKTLHYREMAVLRSYALSLGRSLRVAGALHQQPQWLRHRARGGPLVSQPRPDNWDVLLCCQSVASSATMPVRSASAWAHYYLPKLQLVPSRAQGQRAFCGYRNYLGPKGAQPGNRSSLFEGINILKGALGMMKEHHPSSPGHKQAKQEMLEAILILEKFAADEHHYGHPKKAPKLLSVVVLPLTLSNDLENHDIDDIVEASLRATCLLLENATGDIGSDLRRRVSDDKKMITSLEKIRDCAQEAGALAHKILAQLQSTSE